MYEIKVFSNLIELSKAAADIFMDVALAAVEERGRFCVCLSGGSTPRQTYAGLAEDPFRSNVPWNNVHAFWGDERCVPPNHPDNLYGMALELMLSKVPIPKDHLHRIRGEAENPQNAAVEYEEMLKTFFNLQPDTLPRFDLVFLGMGADGHTASLFPDTDGVKETRRMVIANYVPKLKAYRLSLTLPVINNASLVVFLVAGEQKATALKSVLNEREKRRSFPAGMVNPQNGRLVWLIDQAAASLL